MFYSTFPIREQAPKSSEWDFKLSRVYTIALLNFNMNDDAFNAEDISHEVKLCDVKTKKVFYDKLEFIYLEIAKFNKTENELETLFDKWLYVLKNLSKLDKRPKTLRDKIFDRLFNEAEIAKFTPEELREYESSRKAYRDLKNSLDTALRDGYKKGHAEGREKGLEEGRAEGRKKGLEEGRAEGRAEGHLNEKKETIKRLLGSGTPLDIIAIAVGLTNEEVKSIIDDIRDDA